MRKLSYGLSALLISLILSACARPVGVQEKTETGSLANPPVAPTAVESPTVEDFPVLTPETSPENQPTELVEESLPTAPVVKAGLEATDPTQVQLASGEPQLVEFFAFW
jgi:hypothetical protein